MKPVKVEGASFNKEYWKGRSRQEFLDTNKDAYKKLYGTQDGYEQKSQELLNKAADSIFGATGAENTLQPSTEVVGKSKNK